MKKILIVLSALTALNAEYTIIKDDMTKLMWEDTPHTSETKVNYQEATQYCSDLKLGEIENWRLPTLMDLLSIVDYKRYKPAIKKEFSHVNKDTVYWSSTSYAKSDDEYWGVSFKDGATSNVTTNYDRLIRCVSDLK